MFALLAAPFTFLSIPAEAISVRARMSPPVASRSCSYWAGVQRYRYFVLLAGVATLGALGGYHRCTLGHWTRARKGSGGTTLLLVGI
jgi:hypothetical protein